MSSIKVFLETGTKRTIASAVDWPGWCRGARDEPLALQALVDYGTRYARVLHPAGIEFQTPADVSALVVIERLEGNASTNFGVPGQLLAADREAVDSMELERMRILLAACWQAFDRAVRQAAGSELRKGPRGGGRETEEIVQHVFDADQAYLGRLGWKQKEAGEKSPEEEIRITRQTILRALEASIQGQLPAQGPRGGAFWPPRYFVRRVAWHVLDHAWEVEDRIE